MQKSLTFAYSVTLANKVMFICCSFVLSLLLSVWVYNFLFRGCFYWTNQFCSACGWQECGSCCSHSSVPPLPDDSKKHTEVDMKSLELKLSRVFLFRLKDWPLTHTLWWLGRLFPGSSKLFVESWWTPDWLWRRRPTAWLQQRSLVDKATASS